MCCGQKRSELRNSQAQRTARTVPQYVSGNNRAQVVRTQPSAPAHASISVRYLENSPIRVRGLVSGMCYEFSGSHTVQQVDARDATSLLNTRFFHRA